MLLSGVERDNLRLPERRLLNKFFFPYFAIANLFFPKTVWCVFCRAFILFRHVSETCVCVHTHTPPAHLKDKKWTSVKVTTIVKDTLEMHALQKIFEFELW